MTIKKGLLALVLGMLTTLVLQAQLALTLSDITGEPGQTVEVDLSISGFSDITSMQFSVNWDSTVLDFKSIKDVTEVIPAFSDREIGVTEAPSGAIRVAWFDGTVTGISIPDDTKLFTLTFQLIGEKGANTNITITGEPIVIEFTISDGSMIELGEIVGGSVSIPGTTSTTFLMAPNGMELYQNEPNPFHTSTKIKAILPTAEEVQK